MNVWLPMETVKTAVPTQTVPGSAVVKMDTGCRMMAKAAQVGVWRLVILSVRGQQRTQVS